jgi:hypothetical protein
MDAKQVAVGLAVAMLLILGSARSSEAQWVGGYNGFGVPAYANVGIGVTPYGTMLDYNLMNFGGSPLGISLTRYGASPSLNLMGLGGYGPGAYYAYGNPYAYGAVMPSPMFVGPPPFMWNQTNAMMGVIQSNTGRGNWRPRRR